MPSNGTDNVTVPPDSKMFVTVGWPGLGTVAMVLLHYYYIRRLLTVCFVGVIFQHCVSLRQIIYGT